MCYSDGPNIPGSFEVWTGNNGYFSASGTGTFFSRQNGSKPVVVSSSAITYEGYSNDQIVFSPDLVSSVYGSSLTVQTSSMRGLWVLKAY